MMARPNTLPVRIISNFVLSMCCCCWLYTFFCAHKLREKKWIYAEKQQIAITIFIDTGAPETNANHLNSSARDQIDRINKHVEICSMLMFVIHAVPRHCNSHGYEHLLLHLFVLCLFYSFELWLIDAFIFRFEDDSTASCWALIFLFMWIIHRTANLIHKVTKCEFFWCFINVDLVRPNENTDYFRL